MAIDYNSGAGLFDKVGTVVALTNLLETWQTSVAAGNLEKEMSDLESELEDSKQFDAVAKQMLLEKWLNYKNQLNQAKVSLVELSRLLIASETVGQDYFPESSGPEMAELLRQAMVRDGYKVTANSTGAPTSFSITGFAIASTDKSTRQGPNVVASMEDDGTLKNDTLRIKVVDVTTSFAEKINFAGTEIGDASSPGHPEWKNRLGDLGTVTVYRYRDNRNFIQDPGFSDIAPTGTLNKWVVLSGTLNTHYSVGPSVYSFDGPNALSFLQNASFNQTIPRSKFKPFTMYLLRIEGTTTNSADGTLTVAINNPSGSVNLTVAIEETLDIANLIFATGATPTDVVVSITRTGYSAGNTGLRTSVCLKC